MTRVLSLKTLQVSLSAVLLIGLLSSCRTVPPPAPEPLPEFSLLRADGTRTVDEDGNEIILKGCNFGNWFLLEMWMLDMSSQITDQYTFEQILTKRFGADRRDALMEVYRENWITKRDFAIAQSFCFNAVRIPFSYKLLEKNSYPFKLKPDAFKWLDTAVELAEEHGLYVILDMHAAPGRQSVDHTTGREDQNKLWTDKRSQERMIWIWERIAEHYKDSPVVAAFEPVNEPFGDYKTNKHQPALADLMGRVYDAIREIDNKHIIIFPGTREGFAFYGLPRDHGWKNIMFTEHYYPGVHGGEPGLEAHRTHINRLLPGTKKYLEYVDTPFLVGEFNVVFRRSGGPTLMRQYYDLHAEDGWWSTMWSYKIVKKDAGLGRDNWYMVTNEDPMPRVSIRDSSYEEIESLFKWFGRMNYAVYDDLRAALCTNEPTTLALLDDPPVPMTAPYADVLDGWTGTDIACRPAGGERVLTPSDIDVYGGGRDIWNDHDEFRFFSQEVDGDFSLSATITSLEDVNAFAKAGIMIRNGLEPDAAHILIHVFPNNQVAVGWRPQDGEEMEERKFPIAERPIRFLLEKKGNAITVSYAISEGGWRDAGTHEFEWLDDGCHAGLAVLSHDDRFLARGSFRQVKLEKE